MKQLVFISYSHKDEEIKNRLLSHLQVLEYSGQIELFDTSEITPGVDWSQHMSLTGLYFTRHDRLDVYQS
jgi:hypothetical protein